MEFKHRYDRNKSSISEEEQKTLSKKAVGVIGAGGLGGYLVEQMARVGIGKIIVVDNDVFSESNLNRQRFAKENNLGKSKADEAKKEVEFINSEVEIVTYKDLLTLENGKAILNDADLVLDGVDNSRTRLLMQDLCKQLEIPLVHGAIAGWYGQVSVVMPGDDTLSTIYSNPDAEGIEKQIGNPPFIPALVASYQVAEALKVLLGKGEILRKKLLYIDTLSHKTTIIKCK